MNATRENVLVEVAQERPAFSPARSIAAATIGNALEFYDFITYATAPRLLPGGAFASIAASP
jgi:hypothetical protein